MLKVDIDCHVHTIFSNHAHCTIRDNIVEAAERKLEAIGIADHFGPGFVNMGASNDPGNAFAVLGNFLNTEALPEMWHGVRLFRSVEVDITDAKGTLFGEEYPLPFAFSDEIHTLNDAVLAQTDYAIASIHRIPGSENITAAQGTGMYCRALRHPKIYILGHIGRAGIPFDIDEVLKTAKEAGKIIEINEHSFDFGGRHKDICTKIAVRCAELGVWIAVNSDAHCSSAVGIFPKALAMLEEIGFPQELIANENLEKFGRIIGK